MKNHYSDQDINKFFQCFKALPDPFDISKVHQLINDPNAKATHKVDSKFKPLKLFMMTSTVLIGLSAMFLLMRPATDQDHLAISKPPVSENKAAIVPAKKQQPDTALTEVKEVVESSKVVAKSEPSTKAAPVQEEVMKTSATILEKEVEPTQNSEEKKNTEVNTPAPEECAWPMDTIIDKSNLLVELTDSELEKLGIIKKGKKFYYNNVSPMGNSYAYETIPNDISEELKIETHYTFHPVTHTTIDYLPRLVFHSSEIYSQLDTLVPIVLRIGIPNASISDEIIWFNPHKTLFEYLPDRYKYLEEVYANLSCLKKKYPLKTFTNHIAPVNSPIQSIKLTKEELRPLGISIVEDKNCLVIKAKGEELFSSYCNSEGLTNRDTFDIVSIPKEDFPIFYTDTLGRLLGFMGRYTGREFTEIGLDVLMPIEVNFKKLINLDEETQIWWYYPSDAVIKALPERIREELRIERDAILTDQKSESSSCTFFEACKSTLSVEGFKLYPNPASSVVNLEFVSPEELRGNIEIASISGQKIKELVPANTIPAGFNTYELNISGVPAGIYLINVNTNKGFKTQRLMISQ